MHSTAVYIFLMAFTSLLIRTLPMMLLKKPIENRFIKSFLYYVPYVTLAVMTFPAIMDAGQSPVSGLLALAAGLILAWKGAGLLGVALSCSLVMLLAELV